MPAKEGEAFPQGMPETVFPASEKIDFGGSKPGDQVDDQGGQGDEVDDEEEGQKYLDPVEKKGAKDGNGSDDELGQEEENVPAQDSPSSPKPEIAK